MLALAHLLAAVLQAGGPQISQTAPSQSSCRYDKTAMIALDELAFDQDTTGGWRALANAGCDLAAAAAIHNWRMAHQSQASILYWHEGQLRANAGQTREAIALFDRARKPADEDVRFGWNLYVDGSIAFLRCDRAALMIARSKLARLPRPANYAPIGPDEKPFAIKWPMNLNVLDGFLRCWDQRYKQAYACAAPIFRYSIPAATK